MSTPFQDAGADYRAQGCCYDDARVVEQRAHQTRGARLLSKEAGGCGALIGATASARGQIFGERRDDIAAAPKQDQATIGEQIRPLSSARPERRDRAT